VTAEDVVFVAGTIDPFIRAFDVETGQELWRAELSAPAHATPMTYQLRANGKQFLVIVAGGHPHIEEEPLGDRWSHSRCRSQCPFPLFEPPGWVGISSRYPSSLRLFL